MSLDVAANDDKGPGPIAESAGLNQVHVMDWKGSSLQYASSALNAFGRAVPKGISVSHESKASPSPLVGHSNDGTVTVPPLSAIHYDVPKQQVRAPHIGKIFITATSTIPYLRLSTDDTIVHQDSEALPNQQPFLQKRPLLNVSSSRDKWKKRQWKRDAQLKLQGDHPPTVEQQGEGGAAVTAVRDKHKEKEDHLNLAYAMLMMDVVYIAQTQGVLWVKEILDETGDSGDASSLEKAIHGLLVNPLRLLDDLKWSPGLGRRVLRFFTI